MWEYAREHDFAVVSKDSDFNDLAFIHGPPPKVIWLRVGNASTDQIGELLAEANDVVYAFEANEQDAVLVLRMMPAQPITTPDNHRGNPGITPVRGAFVVNAAGDMLGRVTL